MFFKNALIVFNKFGYPTSAYKYTSFDDPANTVESRLPDLPFDLLNFSVCKLTNNSKVILSGGRDKNFKPSA